MDKEESGGGGANNECLEKLRKDLAETLNLRDSKSFHMCHWTCL